jgi:uncharacterized membrane protein affecting hemolysin expression
MLKDQGHPTEFLPWFVNGTLRLEDREAIDQHVAKCTLCLDEIQFLQKLEQQIKLDASDNTPGRLGYKRLARQIKQENTQQKKSPSRASKWWQSAMVIAVLIIVLQTSLLLQSPVIDDFLVSLGAVENTIQVKFSKNATELKIRQALNAIRGRIVDGPGALGIYRIELELEAGQTESEQVEKSKKLLEKYPGVIQSVTP